MKDDGIGIAPDKIALALTPFKTAGDEAVIGSEGTGLGLPIARTLAQLHDGDLEISPAAPQGTLVTVKLAASRVVTYEGPKPASALVRRSELEPKPEPELDAKPVAA